MALSEREKKMLDEALIGLIDTLVERQNISREDLVRMVSVQGAVIGNISILSSLARIFRDLSPQGYVFNYNKYNKVYSFAKGNALNETVSTFRKEKNILHFDCYDGLTYDFITKSFNIPLESFLNGNRYFGGFLRYHAFDYEWLFNYTDNLYTISSIISNLDPTYYATMPTGFAKAIEENGGLTAKLLEDFVLVAKYGKYKNLACNLMNSIRSSILNKFLTICSFDNLIKMIKNDLVNGIFCEKRDIIDSIREIVDVAELFEVNLDFNRGLSKNVEQVNDLLNIEKNTILEKRLQTLNFINGLQFDEYTVVVPQTQEDKREEGEMQNNCVGYYYDDSIIKGQNLIYFLRKTSNVKHSYITCRYNTEYQNTVEYRKVNNYSVDNRKEEEIIEKISQIIRETLA